MPGNPGIPSKPIIEWNGSRWVGIDVPDYGPTTKPSEGVGPFIMNDEGLGRLFAREQMVDGPFPEHYEPFESPIANRPASQGADEPGGTGIRRRQGGVRDAPDFPYVATTYRLTEHFHFWTKHALINAILQPEEFIEIGEVLAKEKGIAQAGWVRVSSKRGFVVCKAYVTKRIRPLTVDGKPTHVIGVPIHWGFTGLARKGYGANTLTPSVGDANTQTPEFKAFLVNVESDQRPRGLKEQSMTDLQSQDYIRLSASTLTPPSVRDHEEEVAKLIDVSRCIGCKACQAACMEWNNLRDRDRIFRGNLRQSHGSGPKHLDA